MSRRMEQLSHIGSRMKEIKKHEHPPSGISSPLKGMDNPPKGARSRALSRGRSYVEEKIPGEGGQERAVDLHKKLEKYLSAILVREKLPLFRPDTPATVVADWIRKLLPQTKIQEEGAILLCTGSGDKITFNLMHHNTSYPYSIIVRDLYKAYFSE